MARCSECGQDRLLKTCNHCSRKHCSEHILPENHNCPGLREHASVDGDFVLGEHEPEREKTEDEATTTDSERSVLGDVDDPNWSSPDVETERDQKPVSDDGGRISRMFAGAFSNRRFKGLCPHCEEYIRRRSGRLTTCGNCGWKPGLPLLRWLTHVPAWRRYRYNLVSTVWSLLKVALVVALVVGVIGATVGTGVNWLDESAKNVRDSTSGAASNFSDGFKEEVSSAANSSGLNRDKRINETRVEMLVHKYVNQKRAKRGLPALEYDKRLAAIAGGHSTDMATRNYYNHVSPEGHDFEYRYNKSNYVCQVSTSEGYVGGAENIAYTFVFRDVDTYRSGTMRHDSEEDLARALTNMWMNSTGHRKIILKPYWRVEGVGVEVTKNGTVYATQNFC